ncbi:MAG: EamA family transporter [Gammaproteobacteria bacterium]
MDLSVFVMVLMAAVLHASWNAFIKIDGDRISAMAVIVFAQAVISFALLGFVPLPTAESWPFLLVAVILHTGYRVFLSHAYRLGDLSHVYPIARGSTPLIVAVLSVTIVGEHLDRQSLVAVIIIALGIMSLALTRGFAASRNSRAVLLALVTGCFSAAYMIVDGLGARHAVSPHSYMVWVSLLDAPPFLAYALCLKYRTVLSIPRQRWISGCMAGVAGYMAYWIVVWALTVAPMAPVAALRSTSIIFAVIFGVVFLKERLNPIRLAATMAITAGVTMLKLNK